MKPLQALRTAARTVGTVARLAFRGAPWRVSLALAAELLGASLSLASGYAIKFVVQAAVAHNVTGAVWAAGRWRPSPPPEPPPTSSTPACCRR